MESVVIAGASSFIGYYLSKKLVDNYKVTAVIRPDPISRNKIINCSKQIQIVELDMNDYDKMGMHIKECDYYFPLAWDGNKSSDRNNHEKNKYSKDKIIQSVKSIMDNTNCKKVITTGSQAEYGSYHGKITENTVCRPNTSYGLNKYELYIELSDYCKKNNITFIEARLFSIYGIRDSKDKFIMTLISRMLNNEDILLTECIQIWDFLHVRDLVDALVILMKNNMNHTCYNIGTGNNKELRYYIEIIHNLINSKSNLLYGSIPYENDIIPDVDFVVENFMKETGWRPKVNFDYGINEIVNSLKDGRLI